MTYLLAFSLVCLLKIKSKWGQSACWTSFISLSVSLSLTVFPGMTASSGERRVPLSLTLSSTWTIVIRCHDDEYIPFYRTSECSNQQRYSPCDKAKYHNTFLALPLSVILLTPRFPFSSSNEFACITWSSFTRNETRKEKERDFVSVPGWAHREILFFEIALDACPLGFRTMNSCACRTVS